VRAGESLSGNLSVGGSANASTSASASTSANAINLTGTCPMAAKFGLKTVPTYEYKVKTICTDLKTTCCDPTSLKATLTNWTAFGAQASGFFGAIASFPGLLNKLYGN